MFTLNAYNTVTPEFWPPNHHFNAFVYNHIETFQLVVNKISPRWHVISREHEIKFLGKGPYLNSNMALFDKKKSSNSYLQSKKSNSGTNRIIMKPWYPLLSLKPKLQKEYNYSYSSQAGIR